MKQQGKHGHSFSRGGAFQRYKATFCTPLAPTEDLRAISIAPQRRIMHFKTSVLLFASLLTYVSASTIQDILNDLVPLKSALVTLDNDITNLPDSGATLDQALVIHSDSLAVKDAIDATTPDAVVSTVLASPKIFVDIDLLTIFQNVERPVSVDDADSVLSAFQDLQTNIDHSLSEIVDKKPVFDGLGVSSVVAQDLNDLNTSNMALEDALIDAAPVC